MQSKMLHINKSCRSISICDAMPILEVFWLLLDNEVVWAGDQFSQAHYYSIERSCLPNFIQTGHAISHPGEVEDFADKHTSR